MADLSILKQAVIEGDRNSALDLTRQALEAGISPETVLREALITGMERVGALFEEGEYFIPEMLLAARAMHTAMDVLRPHFVGGGYEPVGKVVLGTVRGDLHDIGKNLVGMMLEGTGFEVLDLGSDVAPERFVEALADSRAQLVGLSALLTTTLPAMAETVAAVREAGLTPTARVMIGGAPVTEAFAREIGADGYAPDASAAVSLARRLVNAP